jgi:hypothetical protein
MARPSPTPKEQALAKLGRAVLSEDEKALDRLALEVVAAERRRDAAEAEATAKRSETGVADAALEQKREAFERRVEQARRWIGMAEAVRDSWEAARSLLRAAVREPTRHAVEQALAELSAIHRRATPDTGELLRAIEKRERALDEREAKCLRREAACEERELVAGEMENITIRDRQRFKVGMRARVMNQ